MSGDAIAHVRRFNRLYTERIGALEESYLARDRPLGQARVLWEIGAGSEVRQLRQRLGLDSGYLSRMLRSLEAGGLVRVETADGDARVRHVRLTDAGAVERELLDRGSDELARSLLEPLSGARRDRLVAAMGEIEALLTAGLVEFEAVDPDDPRARMCLEAYFAELGARFETGFDPARSMPADEFRPPGGFFLVASLRGELVASGAVRFEADGAAYIKRMWVDASVRGIGLGRRLLFELEQRSAAAGAPTARLETNRTLVEAIALYRSAGYREIEPFGDEVYAHHWFERSLE